MTKIDYEYDSSEIYRRALARGEKPQTYDPNQLVKDVAALLQERGLKPDRLGRVGMAAGGAGLLLRAFDILPVGGYEATDRPDPECR